MEVYKNLIVWQKSVELALAVYRLTEKFPKTEEYGIKSQMRRCAVSIPSNIAEGKMRQTKKDCCHFFVIAYGSGAELETQIELSKRLNYAGGEECRKVDALLLEVMKMLNRMISSLKGYSRG